MRETGACGTTSECLDGYCYIHRAYKRSDRGLGNAGKRMSQIEGRRGHPAGKVL